MTEAGALPTEANEASGLALVTRETLTWEQPERPQPGRSSTYRSRPSKGKSRRSGGEPSGRRGAGGPRGPRGAGAKRDACREGWVITYIRSR